ncbi:MAG: hypothetical protein JWP97_5752 [Labilithrix sp.]|nr:hypothetical protein [Labilithrix sp.]
MTETELLNLFFERVPAALPDLRVFRRNVGRFKTFDGDRVVHIGIAGQADAYAIGRGGIHVELEGKAARGALMKRQVAWRAWCERWRIPYLVLRARRGETPDETVTRWLEELRRLLLNPAARVEMST